jgi:hypothetical protein
MNESDLLAALGGAPVPFEVKGIPLRIRPLSGADAIAYREFTRANPEDQAGALAKLLALSVVGPGGVPFTEALANRLPFSVAEKIAERVAQVNGWGDAAGNS